MNKIIGLIDEFYYINSIYNIKIKFIDIETDTNLNINDIYNYLIDKSKYITNIQLNNIFGTTIIEFKYKNRLYDIILFNNIIIISLIP